jgi:exonuclease SbcD
VGNHDLPSTLSRASSLDIYATLGVPNVLVADSYTLYTVDTASGPTVVGTAPYPMRAQLLADDDAPGQTGSASIAEAEMLMQTMLQRELARLASEAQATQPADAPRVLAGHFSVTGATFSSERSVMVGRDTLVLLSELDTPAWDYVALGHIHRHQNLTAGRKGAPPVVYSGSLERIDFGEEGDGKGFCWVELARGQTRYSFVPVRSRPFATLRIDVRGNPDPMAKIAKAIRDSALEDAVVRLIIQATEDQKVPDRPIYDALREARVSVVASVRKEIERANRSRLGGSPEGMTPMQLLERFFVAKNIPAERAAQLLARAEALLAEDAMVPEGAEH